ncbi:SAM-dependent methyltransferase [Acidithiobacillus montserratensis]|uniref:SAM-dependent methyltransferase n=1 Tax=Acidithiobacillus montserratensis TaxID=2729135 RepID=A0ACD5HI66_9PROT|nr:SAM-dependent methyltransferase [Acidithiobacillus montserratensis]MBU2748638.1 hypothetical protein [Acidithiobacillus montserratensis]
MENCGFQQNQVSQDSQSYDQVPDIVDKDARFSAVNGELLENLHRQVPDQLGRILEAGLCDIDVDFLGFVDLYAGLAQIIPHPEETTVVDFGCAYAPQAWYFQKFSGYVGIDVCDATNRFVFANTQHEQVHISEYLNRLESGDVLIPGRSFAILSYLPTNSEIEMRIYSNFPNHFRYYPNSKGVNKERPKTPEPSQMYSLY